MVRSMEGVLSCHPATAPTSAAGGSGLIASENVTTFNISSVCTKYTRLQGGSQLMGLFAINKLEVFKGGAPLVVNCPDDAIEAGRASAIEVAEP
ncbi:Indole-3-acetate O-methyltransferase 1 [Camellia lanceoleosa]|uniref:Indole-3-acetate O-methyltransferase 1 n=1 Tax=Camellia lanceoleosa TaxID=1840588 RepID=A0ACC0H078_9ERIC|nr:Indole-3-acetate O-methyltransferase 1 [Camellia lanceoleosa]